MRWTITREFECDESLREIYNILTDGAWPELIDKDHSTEPEWNSVGVGNTLAGFIGRRRLHANEHYGLRAERVADSALLPFRFRIVDDDGCVYFEGRSDDRDSEAAFEPVDWAMKDSGAIHIYYQQDDGQWHLL